MAIATRNPATGETLETFDELSDSDLEAWMTRAGEILDQRTDEIARMMTTEMGKPLAAAKAEVTKCANVCRYYAEHAESYLAERQTDPGAVGASRAYTRWEPLGP